MKVDFSQANLNRGVFQLVEDHGVDVICPIDIDGVGQFGEIRIATGVREPYISQKGKQLHRSIYTDALLNENNLFQRHHNHEVFLANKSSSSLRKKRVNPQTLKSIPKDLTDVEEAIKNKSILRLFYMFPAELKEDFDRVFYFLDDNLEMHEMAHSLAKTLSEQLTADA